MIKDDIEELINEILDSKEWDMDIMRSFVRKFNILVEKAKREAVEECIKLAGIHTEHNGNYCDTGEDMDWACRSECVEMAIKRMLEYLSQLNKGDKE